MKNKTEKKLCYDDVAMKKMRMQRKKKKWGVSYGKYTKGHGL